jgi:hypothetical protein
MASYTIKLCNPNFITYRVTLSDVCFDPCLHNLFSYLCACVQDSRAGNRDVIDPPIEINMPVFGLVDVRFWRKGSFKLRTRRGRLNCQASSGT